MYFNPCLLSDSYKATHWKQYPPGTETVYSYHEARTGAKHKELVFFGLQHLLKRSLPDKASLVDVCAAHEFYKKHLGGAHFNHQSWAELIKDYPDTLPIRIKAVPEGAVVPVGNVLWTIENTDPRFFWLTNFVETVLSHVWYPTTVASQGRAVKKLLHKALKKTGTLDKLPIMLHDFGFRAATCIEQAAIGGAAHLVNFSGTDTPIGIEFVNEFYPTPLERMWGVSVPASEHSTMTAWGQEHEVDAYRNMLEQYPTGPVSVVSDSWDVFNACRNIWGGELKENVLKRSGTLVVRPDSGDPVKTLLGVFDALGHQFGWHTNDKGYSVLPDEVRVLWGDGIDEKSLRRILRALEAEEISLDNMVFGMGSGIMQNVNRDTEKMAIKCSWASVSGDGRDVFKNPKTASCKQSKKGRMKLVRGNKGKLETVPESDPRPDELVEVYNPEVGVARHWTFQEVRDRAAL